MTGYYGRFRENIQSPVREETGYTEKEIGLEAKGLAERLKESIAVSRRALEQEYSIPAAFAAYRSKIKEVYEWTSKN